ncbi:MAG: gliding motility-associated protein GldE [Muribaculaceae bacterium]|nr:gliding motility-associated protein GldE [Muribaculaceae bacterium]
MGAANAITFHTPTAGSIIAIVVAIIGLCFSAFNSGAEIAFFSLSREDINSIDDDDSRERIERLLAAPDRLLATILIGNNLINITIIVMLNFAMSQMMQFNSGIASFLVQTVILTFLILLFGEVIPKLYANSYNVKFARFTAPGLQLMSVLFGPLAKLMMRSTSIVNSRVNAKADDISTEDLSRALEISDVKNDEEKDLLEGILKIGDKTVSEIMTPRVDIIDIDYDSKFDEVVRLVVKHGYSRMPVYQDTPDNIKGILYAKDLLPYIGKGSAEFRWQDLLRSVYFVPESRMIDDLLEDFRRKKIHMAIVVDEYGGTQGLATMEDVLEEIVGDIDDEYDTQETYCTRIDDNTFMFDGKTPLTDFFELSGIDPEAFENVSEEAETLAGMVLAIKGEFLEEKETITHAGVDFTATKLKKFRIARLRVHIRPKAD